MDAKLAAPIAPVAPVASMPVNEVQPTHADASAASGFNQALKQEVDALKPEKKMKEAKDAQGPGDAKPGTVDSASTPSAAEATAAQALAVPTPIAQTMFTLPTGEVLTSADAADETTDTAVVVSTEVTDDPTAIESQASDAIVITQSAPQLTAAQQSVREQRGTLPNATLHNAAQSKAVLPNAALKPNSREGNDSARVDNAAPTQSAARTAQFASTDYVVQAQLQAYEPERATAMELPAGSSHAGAQLDATSSMTLLARWSVQQQVSSEVNLAPASARIDPAIGAPGWGEAFQQKIVWLVDRQQHSAELHINPPHLGPVEIMLNIGEEGTNIMLCSPHAAVREAIESSLPDLRASLAERGLSLGQASVGSDSSAAREQFAEQIRNNTNKPELPAQASLVAEVARLAPRGLVDVFA